MTRVLALRLLLLIPTLFDVLLVTFLLLYVAPGDPARRGCLDDPLPKQFASYAGGILRGDLGRSYITRTGVGIGIYGAWRPGG